MGGGAFTLFSLPLLEDGGGDVTVDLAELGLREAGAQPCDHAQVLEHRPFGKKKAHVLVSVQSFLSRDYHQSFAQKKKRPSLEIFCLFSSVSGRTGPENKPASNPGTCLSLAQ